MLWERLSRHVIYILTKKDSGNVIDVMTDTIKKTLSREEKVTLVGFGSF